MIDNDLNRRLFIGLLLAGGIAAAAPSFSSASGTVAVPARDHLFLQDTEIAFLTAAMERILPSDALGPGAAESGGVTFLDRQLAGSYGNDTRTFRAGPYGAYTPYQGFQLSLTTAQVYRVAIAATDAYCRREHGAPFAGLDPAVQDRVLTQLLDLASTIEMQDIPGAMFARMLIQDTRDSFFSDPVHGGNREMAGWKFANYPGAFAGFLDTVFLHNVPYVSPPPQGMGDVTPMPPMDDA